MDVSKLTKKDYKEVKTSLNYFNRTFSSIPISHINAQIRRLLLSHCPFLGVGIKAIYDDSIPTNNAQFFRIRKNIQNDKMDQISEYLNPPKEYIKSPGRMNRVRESMLYVCPNDFTTAMLEMNIKSGEEIAIIIYKRIAGKSIKVSKIAIDDDHYSNQDNFYSLINNEKLKFCQKWLTKKSSRSFKNGYLYEITNAIKDNLEYKAKRDGCIYPSVKNDTQNYNIAFYENAVNSKLYIKHIFYGAVIRNNSKVCIIKSSREFIKIVHDKVLWRKLHNDQKYIYFNKKSKSIIENINTR